MTHIVQMQLEKMNPAILDTFKRTMQIEDLSARSNALQSMVSQFNLGEMFGDVQTVEFLALYAGEYGGISPVKSLCHASHQQESD